MNPWSDTSSSDAGMIAWILLGFLGLLALSLIAARLTSPGEKPETAQPGGDLEPLLDEVERRERATQEAAGKPEALAEARHRLARALLTLAAEQDSREGEATRRRARHTLALQATEVLRNPGAQLSAVGRSWVAKSLILLGEQCQAAGYCGEARAAYLVLRNPEAARQACPAATDPVSDLPDFETLVDALEKGCPPARRDRAQAPGRVPVAESQPRESSLTPETDPAWTRRSIAAYRQAVATLAGQPDLLAEARHKLALALLEKSRGEEPQLARETAQEARETLAAEAADLLAGSRHLLGITGRLWAARSLLRLGLICQAEGDHGEARATYRLLRELNDERRSSPTAAEIGLSKVSYERQTPPSP